MPRPRSLTPAQIATAAVAVVDRDGLGVLSMRTVAKELGMGTMSLYRYVSDREQVERLMVDLVLRAVDLTMPPGSAGDRLTVLADRVRLAVSDHSAIVPLLLRHRHRAPSSLRWGETVLTVLADAGFTGTQRAIAFRTILGYVFGALQVEYFSPLSGEATATLAEQPDFPLLSETAARAGAITTEREFRDGLLILLRGLGV